MAVSVNSESSITSAGLGITPPAAVMPPPLTVSPSDQKVSSVAQKLQDCHLDEGNSSSIDKAKELIEKGSLDEAFRVSLTISDGEEKTEILCLIATEFYHKKNFQKAYEVAKSIPDKWWQSVTINCIFQAICDQGEPEEIRWGLSWFLAEEQDDTLRIIAERYVKKEKPEKALMLADFISNERVKCLVLCEISEGFARGRNFKQAYEVFRSITETDLKQYTLQNIIDQLFCTPEVKDKISSWVSQLRHAELTPEEMDAFLLELFSISYPKGN